VQTPGFTAEASIYERQAVCYRVAHQVRLDASQAIVPQRARGGSARDVQLLCDFIGGGMVEFPDGSQACVVYF
jgi:hypothetical protein